MKSGTQWLVVFQFPDHEPISFLETTKIAAMGTMSNMVSMLENKKYIVNVYKLNIVKNRIHPRRVKLDP